MRTSDTDRSQSRPASAIDTLAREGTLPRAASSPLIPDQICRSEELQSPARPILIREYVREYVVAERPLRLAAVAPAPRRRAVRPAMIAMLLPLLSLAVLIGVSARHLVSGQEAPVSGPQEIRLILPPPEPSRMATNDDRPQPEPRPAEADRPVKAIAPKPAVAEGKPVANGNAAALAADEAFRSGTLEFWSDGERQGYASAGDWAAKGGQRCRDVTIWEHGSGQGEARTTVRCEADNAAAASPTPLLARED